MLKASGNQGVGVRMGGSGVSTRDWKFGNFVPKNATFWCILCTFEQSWNL